MKLFIKYMLSIRCKMIVIEEMNKLDIPYSRIDLGEVEIKGGITKEQRTQLKSSLLESGLELMEDKKAMLIEKIKKRRCIWSGMQMISLESIFQLT